MRFWLLAFLAAALLAAPVLACGPYFPFGYVYLGNEEAVFAMPQGTFGTELLRLLDIGEQPIAPPGKNPPTDWDITLEADLADLREAFRDTPARVVVTRPDRPLLFRLLIGPAQERRNSYDANRIVELYSKLRQGDVPPAHPDFDFILSLVPEEFALYARGATAWHNDDLPVAARHWQQLLNLAPADGSYRGVWAAFMLGRVHHEQDPAEAIHWYEEARRLANAGCRDTAGLVIQSLGWQAQLEMRNKDYKEAVHHYVDQVRQGDSKDQNSALLSLDLLGTQLVDLVRPDAVLLSDPLVQKVIAAEAASAPQYSFMLNSHLEAMLAVGVTPDSEAAGHIAWGTYRRGDIEQTRRWLAYADRDCLYANWVRAKLLLYDGKIDEAIGRMRVLQHAMEDDTARFHFDEYALNPRQWVQADLGLLLLTKQRYEESLDAYLRGGIWPDAAYVADRVLTLEKVQQYFAATVNDPMLDERRYWQTETLGMCLAELIGRRCARAGLLAEAASYFEKEQGNLFPGALERFGQSLQVSQDATVAPEVRATALMDTASIVRKNGLELLGSELEPDWAIFGGSGYNLKGPAGHRLAGDIGEWGFWQGPTVTEETSRFLLASPDEIARAQAHAVAPFKRFHYRHVAADYAWQAAQLLPDNHPLLALALYTGGMYIENTDPQAADPFYKALVLRCWGLPISAVADKERWFPEPTVFDQLMAGVTAPVFPAEASPLGAWLYEQLGPRVYRKAGWLQQHWPLPVKKADLTPPTQESKDFFEHLIHRLLERQQSP